MIAHTRRVMRAAGMPQAALDAMIDELHARRTGQPSRTERRIAEEFQGQGDDNDDDDDNRDDDDSPPQQRHTPGTRADSRRR